MGTSEDLDTLDPAQGRTLGGRQVFSGLCDKLLDLDENAGIIPRLALSHETAPDGLSVTLKLRTGVVFHDGTPFDAAAVKYNIERALTIPESARKGDIRAIERVDVIDPTTAKLVLKEPFTPLLAQLTDRAGMMISPRAAAAVDAKEFGTKPVCSGPFRFVERVVQDRVVLERFANYWNKDAIHFDRVTYLPIPDGTVRLNNLFSGQLDLVEQISTADLQRVRGDQRFRVSSITGLNHFHMVFNVANGAGAENPFAKNAKLRQAFDLGIDREIINRVVFGGEFVPGNQLVSPLSPYYSKAQPVPKRDVAKAKQLVAESGVASPTLTTLVMNGPAYIQLAQVVQSMLGEVGIKLNVQPMEANTASALAGTGNFQAFLAFWSGRPDPDGNTYPYLGCNGSQNYGKYCRKEVEDLLNQAGRVSGVEQRAQLYAKATELWMQDMPTVPIYHWKWFFAHKAGLAGFKPIPDGLMRLEGVKLQ
ncbi:MAG: ABC transporter substrate-binding protein [Alphaproteobacteria bacterium]|nr:ABC transporter substrate-binding protein [Alphaproteobacteria bacterium]